MGGKYKGRDGVLGDIMDFEEAVKEIHGGSVFPIVFIVPVSMQLIVLQYM